MIKWKTVLGCALAVAGVMTLFESGTVFMRISEYPSSCDTTPLVALAVGVLVLAVSMIISGAYILKRQREQEEYEE